MYRVVIFSLVIVAALADPDNKQCRIFPSDAIHCCEDNAELENKIRMTEDFKECNQMTKDPISCERDLCVAKKKGFATDDNKIDMKKLENILTHDPVFADFIKDIKSNCIDGDLHMYGPPEFCDFIKMKHCISVQMLNHCSKWADRSDCREIKGIVGECVKAI